MRCGMFMKVSITATWHRLKGLKVNGVAYHGASISVRTTLVMTNADLMNQ